MNSKLSIQAFIILSALLISVTSRGDVGCGDKVIANCDTHEIDDGINKSPLNCGKDTPPSYNGKVGETGKGAGTAWPSMKGADIVRLQPELCGEGGCVVHTLPPSHDDQGGAEPAGFNTMADHTGCLNPSPEVLKDLESPSCKGKALQVIFSSKGNSGGGGGSNGRTTSDNFVMPLDMMKQALMYVLAAPAWALPAPNSAWEYPFQLIGAHEMIEIKSYNPDSDTFTVNMANDLHPNPLPISSVALVNAISDLKIPVTQGRFNMILNTQHSTDTDLRVLFKFEVENRRLALQKQKHKSERAPASNP